jgi:putative ABC transport system permease protein
MNSWLEGFAYRIEIDVETYLIAALLTALFAVITVGHQAIRAASANPVNAIRRD